MLYRERLRPPPWMWAFLSLLVVSLALALTVALPVALAVATGVVLAAAGGWGLARTGAVVEVAAGELRAGRAHIGVDWLGAAVALDADEAAVVRGRGINPAAYHLIRGWVPMAVRVEVEDPDDPTPYWYVATRRPHQLVDALNRARQGT